MDKPQVVFATNNSHKIAEARNIAGDRMEILSLDDIDCHSDIPETSDTLEGNAVQKAMWVSQHYGVSCFADDTGLEVEVLDGAPGVKSARYANECGCGVHHDSKANMELLLKNMEGKENRKAQFRTIIAYVEQKDGTAAAPKLYEGVVKGKILSTPKGVDGFGYDPVFVPEGEMLTFAEMSAEQKNSISHRFRAMKAFMQDFKK